MTRDKNVIINMKYSNMNKKRTIRCFTLLELIVAMGIFSILMLLLMQFFSGAQKIWSESEKRNTTYADARIAMDLIAGSIQTMILENNVIPMQYDNDATNPTSYGSINFVTRRVFDADPNTSSIYIVKFSVNHAAATDKNTLQIQYASNTNSSNWSDFYYGATLADKIDLSKYTPAISDIIPYVTKLKFACYDKSNNPLADGATIYPYSVKIEMSLLDKKSYAIWLLKGGNVNDPQSESTGAGTAGEYRVQNERSFSRIIYLGERGQQ